MVVNKKTKVGEKDSQETKKAEMVKKEDDDLIVVDLRSEESDENKNASAEEAEASASCEQEEAIEEDSASTEVKNDGKSDGVDDEDFDLDEVLKTKIMLSDDSECFMFSRGPKYSDDLWPINCHLCRLGNLVSVAQIQKHLKSKMHQRRLAGEPPNKDRYMDPFRQSIGGPNQRFNKPIRILPGEIITEITPELEDRLIKITPFELKPETNPENLAALSEERVHEYNKKSPVIGLCYVLKMRKQKSIVYYCTLCDLQVHGDGYQHFVGTNHQANYIVKHFPKLYERVVNGLEYMKNASQQTKSLRDIFRKIYRKIENAKGFRQVTIVDSVDFFRNRRRYNNYVMNNVNHYDEKTIVLPDHEINSMIKKSAQGITLMKPDPLSLDREPNVSGRQSENPGLKNNRTTTKRQSQASPIRGRTDVEPPKKSRNYIDDKQDWQRYRVMLGKLLDELDDMYDRYERTPEKHPQYATEWKKFWRRRNDELERDNIDPRSYDFDKEWVPFWLKRLREFHAKDIVQRKLEVKRTLRLPNDRRSPSPIRQSRRPRRSPTPPSYNKKRYQDRPRGNMVEEPINTPTEPLSVISVLRLLTALEDQLGSLGPKAIDLLSKAVICEKNKQNTNNLLMENDFYVLFITSREKLKGQLLANIVEPLKTRAVNKVIEDITTILNLFEDYMSKQGGNQGNMGGGNLYNNSNNFANNMRGNQFDNNIPDRSSDNRTGNDYDNQIGNLHSGNGKMGIWGGSNNLTNRGGNDFNDSKAIQPRGNNFENSMLNRGIAGINIDRQFGRDADNSNKYSMGNYGGGNATSNFPAVSNMNATNINSNYSLGNFGGNNFPSKNIGNTNNNMQSGNRPGLMDNFNMNNQDNRDNMQDIVNRKLNQSVGGDWKVLGGNKNILNRDNNIGFQSNIGSKNFDLASNSSINLNRNIQQTPFYQINSQQFNRNSGRY